MINPFVSVDQQLEDIGYVRQYEGRKGFVYAKNVGGGYIFIAEAIKYEKIGVRFYDPNGYDETAIFVSDKELKLFARKLKEWKEQYERKDNN